MQEEDDGLDRWEEYWSCAATHADCETVFDDCGYPFDPGWVMLRPKTIMNRVAAPASTHPCFRCCLVSRQLLVGVLEFDC